MSLAFLTITILTPERWKLKSELLCFPDGKGCWAVSCFLAVCSASSENALVSALDYFNWVVDFLMFRFYLERWSSPANNTPIGCPVPNSQSSNMRKLSWSTPRSPPLLTDWLVFMALDGILHGPPPGVHVAHHCLDEVLERQREAMGCLGILSI